MKSNLEGTTIVETFQKAGTWGKIHWILALYSNDL